jgi:hypothetical protein
MTLPSDEEKFIHNAFTEWHDKHVAAKVIDWYREKVDKDLNLLTEVRKARREYDGVKDVPDSQDEIRDAAMRLIDLRDKLELGE